MTNEAQRDLNLDVLRASSILGVILIHIIGASFQYWRQGSPEWAIFIAIDQFFRFSVPLFVFISGFTLYSKYKDNFNFWEFYTKRAVRILPWYFVWSLIIYLYINFTVVSGFVNYPFWKLILLGKVDYHLYFVSMIVQLYLLFPVLLWLFKKTGNASIIVLFIFTVILCQIFTLDGLAIIQLPWRFYEQQQYLFSGTWIFYFVLGFALADKKSANLMLLLNKYKPVSLAVVFATLAFAIYDCFQLISTTSDTNIATRSTRIPILLYSTTFVITAFLYSDLFLKLNSKLLKPILYFASLSFLVYLTHALVIRIIGNFILPTTLISLFIFTLLVISISIFLAQLSLFFSQLIPIKKFLERSRLVAKKN